MTNAQPPEQEYDLDFRHDLMMWRSLTEDDRDMLRRNGMAPFVYVYGEVVDDVDGVPMTMPGEQVWTWKYTAAELDAGYPFPELEAQR